MAYLSCLSSHKQLTPQPCLAIASSSSFEPRLWTEANLALNEQARTATEALFHGEDILKVVQVEALMISGKLAPS